MHEQAAWLTEFVNHHLGHVALALLAVLHIQPSHPELPIPQRVVMAVVVVIIGTIFVFVLLGNLMGAFPSSFLTAPTSDPTVPLACAVLTFVYFNWQGARRHGVAGYLLTFAGSPKDFGAWILAILLFPVEVVSTTARILSLTVRLWANMFASDLIYLIFVGLLAGGASFGWGKSPLLGVVLAVFPATTPVLFIGLHVFVSVIQAYVFTVLPDVYLGLATAEEH